MRLKRVKFLIVAVSLISLLPIIKESYSQNHNLKATTLPFTSPIFNLYDKVIIGNRPFTVIQTGGSLRFLADTYDDTLYTGREDLDGLVREEQYLQTMFHTLGASVFEDNVKIPSYSDFDNVKIDEKLNESIPKGTVGWWLKENDSKSRKGVTKNNELKSEQTYKRTSVLETGCVESDITAHGFFTSSFSVDEKKKTFNESGSISFDVYRPVDGLGNGLFNVRIYGNFINSVTGKSVQFTPWIGTTKTRIIKEGETLNIGTIYTADIKTNNNGRTEFLKMIKEIKENADTPFNLHLDYNYPNTKGCDVFSKDGFYSLRKDVPGDIASPLDIVVYVQTTVSYILYPTLVFTPTIEINGGTVTCPAYSYTATSNGIRPVVEVPSDEIVLGTKDKRIMTPSSSITENVPGSNGVKNLMFQTDILSVELDTSNGLVKDADNVFVPIGATSVEIPLKYKNVSEGTNYITAVVENKYGVLKEVTGEKDTVTVDLSNLTKDANGKYNITLYQENHDDASTSYISKGKDIIITEAEVQTIDFESSQITEVAVGDELQISALLEGDVTAQANTNLTFSVIKPEGAVFNAYFVSQSYDASSGRAKGVFKCDNYVGPITIAINKAGGTNGSTYIKAEEKTIIINVVKKQIKISVDKPNMIYKIDDSMPELTRSVEGMESKDSRIVNVVPKLEKLNDAYADHPAENGILKHTGTWKLILPETSTLDTDLYDLILYDYNDDPSLVFTVFDKEITSWFKVSPEANTNGWNNSKVILEPSDIAKSAGYTSIEVVNDAGVVLKQGTTIEYTTSIDSVTPKVRLKKGTATSDAAALREIKIDLTKPTGTITVENDAAWVKGTKKVTITPSDTYSGIDTITVKNENEKNYTPVQSGAAYTFDADENAIYTVTLTDKAGNEKELTQTVEKIETKEIALTAVPKDLTNVEPSKDITVTRDAGDSGIKTFILYYKETAQDTYEKLEDLDQTNADFTYVAEMNGIFKFELVNNAGQSIVVEVTITNVNPPVPVTKITAVYDDDNSKTYTSGKWTNHDIQLSLTNVNTEITDTVSWMISENGTDWEELNSTTKTISTSDILNTNYHFKAYITKNGTKVEETNAKKMTIKIDKIKPAPPTIKDKDSYGSDKWFKEDVKVETSIMPKLDNAEIQQDIYVCVGTESECKNTGSIWTKTTDGTKQVSANGNYEYYFKTIDEAGNESDLSDPVLVNINDSVPVITIKLNTNPIKDFINALTFGIFFKDTVNIDFAADMNDSDIYYILDSNENPTTPADDDNRWVKGTSTSLAPDAKAMIYVKAVSKAGVIGRKDSQFNVYADNTPPVIELPANAAVWTKEITMEASIHDAMSGVKKDSITYSIDGGGDTSATLTNGKITISNLKDGSYNVSVKASDHSGNNAAAQTTVKIDHTKPTMDTPITDTLDYAKEHTITFHTSDALSGLASGYPKVDGDRISANADGSYSFKTDTNKTYQINVLDNAGNAHTINYVESKIDDTAPVITNKVIENETDFKTKKKVSFDTTDTESGIDTLTVTYTKDGETHNVNVQVPTTGDTYSFTATENATYTITVTDKAGNTKTETIKVENIDPDGIKIKNISDTSSWVKDEMQISFEVQVGSSGIQSGYPTVTCPDQTNITVTKTQDTYSFTASENSDYTITARNEASDEAQEVLRIRRIDKEAPVIHDISSNVTSTTWRGPQDITFHVDDDNDSAKNTKGSGMKSGYPKVSYMENGTQNYISVTQDTTDSTLYTFKAEKNTTYGVEAMDQVEHPVVKETIMVDHILDESMLSDISVEAKNNDKNITSGTWVKGDILFTISGGLDDAVRTKYQVAISDGIEPTENDWQDLNMASTNQHKVTGNEKNKHYYFRVQPDLEGTKITSPFIVNLDNTAPANVEIIITKKNNNPIAHFINALTFGGWMKEAQSVSFKGTDNFTSEDDLRFEYREEKDEVKGSWISDTGNLSYEDSDIVIYAKAIDQAGNESIEDVHESLRIDTLPPVIEGAKDQKEYKQYYLPRFVSVSDMPINGSGIKTAYYTKDKGEQISITEEVKIKNISHEPEIYVVYTEDRAGNSAVLTFTIVPLPDIKTEIDGSDESRDIIDQITKELEEVKGKIDDNEKNNYEKWIKDAEDTWNRLRKKVVEDEETTSKVEGQGDTTFDPKTELIVEEIPKEEVPVLPRNAIKTYDVYLKKGNTVVQANGSVKVYLPYDEKEAPIVYEIREDGTITEIPTIQEGGYVTFITDTLSQYAISNTAQDENKPNPDPTPKPDPDPTPTPKPDPTPNPDEGKVCVAGPDGKLGTEDDVCVDPGDNEKPDKNPDGSIDVPGGGVIVFPDGGEIPIGPDDTGTLNPDGSVEIKPSGDKYGPDGKPIKPDTCPNEGTEINIDTNKDGKPDLNIDIDGDCKADLNIDTDGDHIPDVNIDTTLDGKPDYNIDLDEDGKPDVNIGPVNDPWKPTVCKSVGTLEYCSDSYKAPYLNVDTDGDGRPDLNLDLDGDLEADLNIDIDGDSIPDVNIDSDGDGKPDINVDIDNDGKADENLVKLTKWTPNKDVDGKIKYDTMTGLVPDPELNKNPNEGGYLSGTDTDITNMSAQGGAYTNADTGDIVKTSFWWILVLINGVITILIWSRHKQKNIG